MIKTNFQKKKLNREATTINIRLQTVDIEKVHSYSEKYCIGNKSQFVREAISSYMINLDNMERKSQKP